MLYLGTSPVPEVVELLDEQRIGLMCAPAGGAPPRPGWLWAADNGCFSPPGRPGPAWYAGEWLAWLEALAGIPGCLFASVPDRVADARATLRRWRYFSAAVRELGFPVAFVAQDGQEDLPVPWGELDCLFVGGSTGWKLGEASRAIAVEARARGKYVHVGRINSGRRYRAWALDADSCDGTFLAWAPTNNVPRLLRWLDDHAANPQLWESTG